MKNCIISVFSEVINSSATSMCSIIIKITLHYSIHMRISDEAEHVQSVSYFHIRSLSGLYAVVCLREGKRGTCLAAALPFQRHPSRYFAHKSSCFGEKFIICSYNIFQTTP